MSVDGWKMVEATSTLLTTQTKPVTSTGEREDLRSVRLAQLALPHPEDRCSPGLFREDLVGLSTKHYLTFKKLSQFSQRASVIANVWSFLEKMMIIFITNIMMRTVDNGQRRVGGQGLMSSYCISALSVSPKSSTALSKALGRHIASAGHLLCKSASFISVYRCGYTELSLE